jgi:LmbE family N-acetylglucosaminyl deacetylase
MLVVISPHLDDAVFSCGALLAERECRVFTICAGIPAETVAPGIFDAAAGLASAADAIRARRAEDDCAAEVLGMEVVHLDALEDQYRADTPPTIAEAVTEALMGLDEHDIVLAPLGLRHPDHVRVAKAVRAQAPAQTWLYEELPYRALWPQYVAPAIKAAACSAATEYFADIAPPIKHRALQCYPSQLVGMDTQPLLLPERYHCLTGDRSLW